MQIIEREKKLSHLFYEEYMILKANLKMALNKTSLKHREANVIDKILAN